MTIDGAELKPGNFYLWRVAVQQGTGIDLHSVYFMTEDEKVYEVVFSRPEGDKPSGWYLVEKNVKPEDKIPEAEIVESIVATPDGSDTLSIQVEDELKLGDVFGG